jgi:hypothetical protein
VMQRSSALSSAFPRFATTIPLALGLLFFVANNLAPLGALLHPRPGFVPLLVTRTEDNAQYLTWIEAFTNGWGIPNYHAPWQTEPALHVPLVWLVAKVAVLSHVSRLYAYLGFEAACYVLAFYALALLLKLFTPRPAQSALAIALMICAVPLRSYALLPALLLKGTGWAVLLCGYEDFSSDGLFLGISDSATITFGTATALLCLALFSRYFDHNKRSQLWAASMLLGLSGFLHPFEFIPITMAASVVLIWNHDDLRSLLINLLILCVPASAAALFYFLPTLTHPWLKITADLGRFSHIDLSHHFFLHLGWPLFVGFILAFFPSKNPTLKDRFLACYVVIALVGMRMPFLPWPLHFKDGLDYAAAILIVRKLTTSTATVALWANRGRLRLGFAVLLLGAAVLPHVYFRIVSYQNGARATEISEEASIITMDEVEAIAWLRAHGASDKLILAPAENAPWMATVPMHSFASHWLFSLTKYQQAGLSTAFFQGTLSNESADFLLKSYGVRYVLVPLRSPALRYLHDAELRWTGEGLALYEFPRNFMSPVPALTKDAPGNYVWNPASGAR